MEGVKRARLNWARTRRLWSTLSPCGASEMHTILWKRPRAVMIIFLGTVLYRWSNPSRSRTGSAVGRTLLAGTLMLAPSASAVVEAALRILGSPSPWLPIIQLIANKTLDRQTRASCTG